MLNLYGKKKKGNLKHKQNILISPKMSFICDPFAYNCCITFLSHFVLKLALANDGIDASTTTIL